MSANNITYTLKINEETAGHRITDTDTLIQELQVLKQQGETIVTLEANPWIDGVIIIQGIGRHGVKKDLWQKARRYEIYDMSLTKQESDGSFKLYVSYLKEFADIEQFFVDFFERQIVPDTNTKGWKKV